MIEQRLNRRLMKYWNLVRKARPLPEIQQFNPAAIEDVWPFCFRVSVDRRHRLSFKYEYMGEPIAKIYGQDLTDMTVDCRMKHFPGAVIHQKLADVVEKGAPLIDEGHFMAQQGYLIKYRACILPFGNTKKGMTHIVVGLSCRYF